MKILNVLFYVVVIGLLGVGLVGGYIAERKEVKRLETEFAASPLAQAPTATDSTDTGGVDLEPAPTTGGILAWAKWLWNNFEEIAGVLVLLIMAIDPIIRWTPTERDNNVLRIIQSWLDRLIPNARKAGGVFAAFTRKEDAPKIAAVVPPKQE
jgi:hypothetical protein